LPTKVVQEGHVRSPGCGLPVTGNESECVSRFDAADIVYSSN
jgi:hypothetical protein